MRDGVTWRQVVKVPGPGYAHRAALARGGIKVDRGLDNAASDNMRQRRGERTTPHKIKCAAMVVCLGVDARLQGEQSPHKRDRLCLPWSVGSVAGHIFS